MCSYLEQKVPGTAVGVSIIYYDVLKGRGGESAFPILRKLAGGGRGRLHHFMGTSERVWPCEGCGYGDMVI